MVSVSADLDTVPKACDIRRPVELNSPTFGTLSSRGVRNGESRLPAAGPLVHKGKANRCLQTTGTVCSAVSCRIRCRGGYRGNGGRPIIDATEIKVTGGEKNLTHRINPLPDHKKYMPA